MDLLSASSNDNKIAWYANADGLGSFGAEQEITTSADGVLSIAAADVDGDGDLDVLSASYRDNKIAWYENTDGFGTFGAPQVITAAASGARMVEAADVDGDGDLDALSTSFDDGTVAWYENTDGAGTFGAQQLITSAADGAFGVCAADVDGDGDLDVLSASQVDNTVAWYANTDGLGTFGAQQVITASAVGARSVCAVDVDGDGDLDVLSASHFDDTIAWFENLDGQGDFGVQQVIRNNAARVNAVRSADIDGDGDLDILSASFFGGEVAWYENVDGLGSFSAPIVITTAALGAFDVRSADVDGDGDLDVLSASTSDDKIATYENLRTARLGSGCAGLLLRADAPMRVGVTSTVIMDNVPAVQPFGLFLLGSRAMPAPLPLNTACTARIVPDLPFSLVATAQGRAELSIPVPADAALVGAQLAVQGTARSLDPSAWRNRWAISNGLLYTVGN